MFRSLLAPVLLLLASAVAGAWADELVFSGDFEAGSGAERLIPVGGDCPAVPAGFRVVSGVSFNRNSSFGTGYSYEQVFGPFPLAPGHGGATFDLSIPRDTVVSLAFEVPADVDPEAFVLFEWVFFADTSEGTSISVSRCRGGILSSMALEQGAAGEHRCLIAGRDAGGSFVLGTNPAARCVLEPGQRYFLNIADYDEALDAGTCRRPGATYCTWKVRPAAYP